MIEAKPSRSLRADLTRSYTALVALIVTGFAATLFIMNGRATYRQVEAELLGAAQVMVQDLKDGQPADRLTIPAPYLRRFGRARRDHAYFAVWDMRGKLLAATANLPRNTSPVTKAVPTRGRRSFVSRSHGTRLEITVSTPGEGRLLIGRPLAKEFDFLLRLAVELILIVVACLLVGAAGAWWLARRISEPIARMAETAESITSKNLKQRIEIGEGPLEVTRLAHSFNTMLDGLDLAFDRQSRFTADASHELRTPVAIVLAQAEHTLSRERSPDDYREALQTCLRASRRMKVLIDNLLLLAKADSGRLDLREEIVDLGLLASKIVDLLKPLANKNQVRLKTKLGIALVRGDSARLEQVLMNLITNAIQYNRPAGNVFIFVAADVSISEVRLVVRDEGQGIPEADQPRLFDRFHRVDLARTLDDETGTGLGLSLVAEFVDAHRGTIQLQSQLGKGTTMTVTFPLAKPDDTALVPIPRTSDLA